MVAGGISLSDIAACIPFDRNDPETRSISLRSLHNHYKPELRTGSTKLNSMVVIEHIKAIRAGNFNAIKWWEQSRMGWREHIVVDDGRPADTPLRVVVELVGEAAAPRAADQSAQRPGASRLSDDVRRNVQLVG